MYRMYFPYYLLRCYCTNDIKNGKHAVSMELHIYCRQGWQHLASIALGQHLAQVEPYMGQAVLSPGPLFTTSISICKAKVQFH